MHINVKNVILAKLIAQYFNLIISENRKNVVKSFPPSTSGKRSIPSCPPTPLITIADCRHGSADGGGGGGWG